MLVLVLVQLNHLLGRCREPIGSQGSDVGSGLGWECREEASGESFRSTTGVYSRPSQLFINV